MLKKLTNIIIVISEKYLPSPTTITMILTLIVLGVSLILPSNTLIDSANHWYKGFWELLTFTMQMTLILVLGHALASTQVIDRLISKLTNLCSSNKRAVVIVSVSTLLVSFFNWGLGLVFGALFARKVAEHSLKKKIEINYPLIGASAYSGLIIWHGGFSGSAPLTVATGNHFLSDTLGIIDISSTILTWQNLLVTVLLLCIIPIVLSMLSNIKVKKQIKDYDLDVKDILDTETSILPNDKMDNSQLIKFSIVALLGVSLVNLVLSSKSFTFINLNFINLLCLTLGILLHKSLKTYTSAIDDAIKGVSGIIFLFPFYAGIMGIMKYSGLASMLSEGIASFATESTFPLFTFISSGLVNLFVPSGGGQWAVQGGILADAAGQLGISKVQMIMAFSYGDELTNMLQPFWALPLLGITKLKAKEIIPYTLIIMLISIPIFILGIYLYN